MQESDRHSSWRIWKQSAQFYREHLGDLAILAPLLFLPIFVDAFVAFLIAQKQTNNQLEPLAAIRSAFVNTPRLFAIKFRFEISGGLWSLIPLLGWYKTARHRMCWAMGSNVIAFEDLSIAQGIKRCIQLIDIAAPDRSFRTLITIPTIIESILLVLLALGVFVLQSSFFFWVPTFFFLWTLLPWSAAVNTYFYLSLPKEEVEQTLDPYKRKLSFEDFCPKCAFFLQDQGICERLRFNVLRYPKQFTSKCNSKFYQPRGAT